MRSTINNALLRTKIDALHDDIVNQYNLFIENNNRDCINKIDLSFLEIETLHKQIDLHSSDDFRKHALISIIVGDIHFHYFDGTIDKKSVIESHYLRALNDMLQIPDIRTSEIERLSLSFSNASKLYYANEFACHFWRMAANLLSDQPENISCIYELHLLVSYLSDPSFSLDDNLTPYIEPMRSVMKLIWMAYQYHTLPNINIKLFLQLNEGEFGKAIDKLPTIQAPNRLNLASIVKHQLNNKLNVELDNLAKNKQLQQKEITQLKQIENNVNFHEGELLTDDDYRSKSVDSELLGYFSDQQENNIIETINYYLKAIHYRRCIQDVTDNDYLNIFSNCFIIVAIAQKNNLKRTTNYDLLNQLSNTVDDSIVALYKYNALNDEHLDELIIMLDIIYHFYPTTYAERYFWFFSLHAFMDDTDDYDLLKDFHVLIEHVISETQTDWSKLNLYLAHVLMLLLKAKVSNLLPDNELSRYMSSHTQQIIDLILMLELRQPSHTAKNVDPLDVINQKLNRIKSEINHQSDDLKQLTNEPLLPSIHFIEDQINHQSLTDFMEIDNSFSFFNADEQSLSQSDQDAQRLFDKYTAFCLEITEDLTLSDDRLYALSNQPLPMPYDQHNLESLMKEALAQFKRLTVKTDDDIFIAMELYTRLGHIQALHFISNRSKHDFSVTDFNSYALLERPLPASFRLDDMKLLFENALDQFYLLTIKTDDATYLAIDLCAMLINIQSLNFICNRGELADTIKKLLVLITKLDNLKPFVIDVLISTLAVAANQFLHYETNCYLFHQAHSILSNNPNFNFSNEFPHLLQHALTCSGISNDERISSVEFILNVMRVTSKAYKVGALPNGVPNGLVTDSENNLDPIIIRIDHLLRSLRFNKTDDSVIAYVNLQKCIDELKVQLTGNDVTITHLKSELQNLGLFEQRLSNKRKRSDMSDNKDENDSDPKFKKSRRK